MSKGLGPRPQELQRQNEDVQKFTMAKSECYKLLSKTEEEETFEEYKGIQEES